MAVKAGKAIEEQLESDPTWAAKQQAYAEGFRSALQSEEVKAAIREAEQWEAEWSSRYGEPLPKSLDDWLRWARRVELTGETIIRGDWAPADLLPLIEGELQRFRGLPKAGSSAAPKGRKKLPKTVEIEKLIADKLDVDSICERTGESAGNIRTIKSRMKPKT